MRILVGLSIAVAVVLMNAAAASAAPLVAKVDLSSQTMTVIHRGAVKYNWRVSTARPGKVTPTGTWTAKWLSRHHKSSRYNNAPMPYSIFYSGNFAIHGTNQISRLGRPASAGCIRLHPKNAAVLFSLVKQVGLKNMRVVVRH
ncbi:L,D-transpeptidase [Oricola sp.]|uniref:L,D-transpeptidase n=1 Tax=Oricola sp. TaxID=1979950 RepID=UPI003BAC2D4F